MGYLGRDVEVTFLEGDLCLVTACDSCGAIGDKELDVVKVPPLITGQMTSRVVLAEILSVGAEPRLLTAAICNEPDPTAEGVLTGIRQELKKLSMSHLPITISTEKNIPTRQTAIGITAIGICRREKLRIGLSQPGDVVYCLGIPKVGHEFKGVDDPEILQLNHIQLLSEWEGIHDIIPVGSRGIKGEASTLAEAVGCSFVPSTPSTLDLDKSAGPSTCLLFTCPPSIEPSVMPSIPYRRVGVIAK